MLESALAKAQHADVLVLDVFQSSSLSAPLVRTLRSVHRPVRIIGANKHVKRLLKLSRLDTTCCIVDQTMPLCQPCAAPGIHYVELEL